MLVEIVGTAKIERGKTVIGVRVLSLPKKFAAGCQGRPEIALHEPATKGIITLAGRGIQGRAAAAVSCPWPPTLLQPQRQAKPGPSIAQPSAGLACRHFGHWENP